MLSVAWHLAPMLLAVVGATVLTNFWEVVRARIVCEMSKEVFDLSEFAEEGRSSAPLEGKGDVSLWSMLLSELRIESEVIVANMGILLRSWRCFRWWKGYCTSPPPHSPLDVSFNPLICRESEIFFASPTERYDLKPCAFWIGLIPRLLYTCISFTITIIWAYFLGFYL